jgi:antitoxin PrlF
MKATVSSKGQITLPRAVREALGITKGSTLSLRLAEGEVSLSPVATDAAGRLAGSLRRYGRPGRRAKVRAQTRKRVARAAASEGSSR